MAGATTAAVAQPVPVPQTPRDFRGLWMATVTNIDWPRTSDSTATQQLRLRQIMDRAVELNLNVIVFQVRPACDAFYSSPIEPWSQWLKGTQGVAPSPFYDPLQYAIEQAHARGLELHAWFNPYRAGFTSTTTFASNHIRNQRPDLVRTYSSFYWLDPGHPDVQAYSRSVVMDVLNRYNVDGIHFDDYFYPYSDGTAFPDDATFAAYGGGLTRANWRRKNVNDFVQSVYNSIRTSSKPTVRFGLSPFGIWRPGNPPGITGLDSFASIYADSKLWFNNGWVDYFAPQLYWRMTQSGQEYDKLLGWWISQNTFNRTLAPGLFTSKVSFDSTNPWQPQDIVDQVVYTQATAGGHGNIHFSARQFMSTATNATALVNSLKNGAYAKPALVPASTWLDNVPPPRPIASSIRANPSSAWTINWTPASGEQPWLYVVHYLAGNTWEYRILPSTARTLQLPGTGASAPTWAAVTAVDRVGNESTRTILDLSGDGDRWQVN